MDNTVSAVQVKQAREKDALALAELIYDMFKEVQQRENDRIDYGQNNAESTEIL